RRELRQRHIERLRPELPHARRQTVAQLEPSELAAVIVVQRAPVQRQDGVRVLPGRAIHEQLPGHPEVYDKGASTLQHDLYEFAVPPHIAHFASRESRRGGIRIALQYAQTSEFRAHDAATAEPRSKRPRDRFHFRQFRHFGSGYPGRFSRTSPFSIFTSQVATFFDGSMSFSPVAQFHSHACHGHTTYWPFIAPCPSGPPRCGQIP